MSAHLSSSKLGFATHRTARSSTEQLIPHRGTGAFATQSTSWTVFVLRVTL